MFKSRTLSAIAEGFTHHTCAVLSLLLILTAVRAEALADIRKKEDAVLIEQYRARGAELLKEEIEFHNREINCLTNAVIREARGELRGVRHFVTLTILARRYDADPQWPKTVCGVTYQKGAFSGITNPMKFSTEVWNENHALVANIYRSMWKTQFMPKGWECVRYLKMSDEKIAKLTPKHWHQLRLTERGLSTFKKLVPVMTLDSTTFYRDPKRCVTKLPTLDI